MSYDKPEVGDIWKECDPRIVRFVRILKVVDSSVMICTVELLDGRWTRSYRNGRSPDRKASLGRFNGRRGGYIFAARERQ